MATETAIDIDSPTQQPNQEEYRVYELVGRRGMGSVLIKEVDVLPADKLMTLRDKEICQRTMFNPELTYKTYKCRMLKEYLDSPILPVVKGAVWYKERPIIRVYYNILVDKKNKNSIDGTFQMDVDIDGMRQKAGQPVEKFKSIRDFTDDMEAYIFSRKMEDIIRELVVLADKEAQQEEEEKQESRDPREYIFDDVPKPTLKLRDYYVDN